eukprot:12163742-Alexandrium_andersonii.AAC.1
MAWRYLRASSKISAALVGAPESSGRQADGARRPRRRPEGRHALPKSAAGCPRAGQQRFPTRTVRQRPSSRRARRPRPTERTRTRQ